MPTHLSRRQFLMAGTAGGLSLAFAPLLGEPARAAPPTSTLPERVLAAAAPAPFQPLPSTLPLGKPLTDIAMGWDGSVWGIDTDGVPHQYDQLAQRWTIYAAGINAITAGASILVRGAEVFFPGNGSQPQSLASVWSGLPDSFAAGVDGAATVQDTLYLFRHGRYLAVNLASGTVDGVPRALRSLTNWPTAAAWQSDVLDAVGSNPSYATDPHITLWANGEFLTVDIASATVVTGPQPYSAIASGQMLTIMEQGFSALQYEPQSEWLRVFQGPVMWTRSTTTSAPFPTYMGYAPSPWAPLLAHAPSGVTGTLWAATTDAGAVVHDGDTWQSGPTPVGGVRSLAAGQDGAVFSLTAAAMFQLASDKQTWNQLATAPSGAAQISAGDAGHVWVRDAQNGVHRYGGGQFSTVSLGQPATDIAANADGTLWHASTGASLYRFLSEGTAPSSAVPVGAGITQVSKVASTGFGTAFVLASPSSTATPQLYSYDSRYVFKTGAVYTPQFLWGLAPNYLGLTQAMAVGGHSIFLVSSVARNWRDSSCKIVALDAQTGAELWPKPFQIQVGYLGVASVVLAYDAALQLVYVTGGRYLHALDAVTGTLVWTMDFGGLGKGTPLLGSLTLHRGQLCVGNLYGTSVTLIDTADALARTKQRQTPVALWSATLPSKTTAFVAMGAPAFDSSGTMYVTSLDGSNPAAPVYALTALRVADGSTVWHSQLSGGAPAGMTPVLDMIVGQAQPPTASTTTAAVFVNLGSVVQARNAVDGSVLHTFSVPPTNGNILTSGLSALGDRLYVGDAQGTLYVLDTLTLTVVAQTRDVHQAVWQGVLSRPALIRDDGDDVAVAFTRGDASVWLFDPASGTVEQVSTDQTAIAVVAYDDSHGVLYAASWNGKDTQTSLGQFFALRLDQAIQDERAFTMQSQLLQDYATDAEATGTGVARYQTHVTIVDATKTPRATVSVKLWADADGTAVAIDGTAFTIGPNTPALFTTDASGTFTITSTASDLQATTLRLWAAFMDTHERIAIVPDAEFHGRLATTTAAGSTDPQQIDTVSAQSYNSTPLFAASERAHAADAATATTQLAGAVGLGGTTSLSDAQDTPAAKYTVYAALPGMRYTPISAALTLPVVVGAPLGFSLTTDGHTPLTPAAAADLIDRLEGRAPAGALLGDALSTLKAAWNEIKHTAATVTQVVVSVASEVYAGIQYVVNGVTKVVKAVVKDIKDAAAAIGSFFVQLGKDLLKVIEAFSVLLHLGEVIKTAGMISAMFNDMLGNLGTVLTAARPVLDAKFASADAWITAEFCSLIAALSLPTPAACSSGLQGGASQPLSGFGNMGATPTTIYTVSNADGSPAPSTAVQSQWSSHTLRTNVGQATPDAAGGFGATDDPFGTLLTLLDTFGDSLLTNPQLSSAFADVQRSFGATFQASSVEQFLALAVEDILEVFKALLITGVSLVQALVDTLLSEQGSGIIVSGLTGLGSARIPILSALWHAATGKPLTVIDLVAFVLAFPVTMVYRAVEGVYPGDDTTLESAAGGSLLLKRVEGLVGGTAQLVAGPVLAVIDGIATANAEITSFSPNGAVKTPPLATGVGGVLQLLAAGTSIYTAVTSKNDAQIVSAALSILAPVLALTSSKNPELNGFLGTILTLTGVLAGVAAYEELNQPTLTLSREVVASFSSLIKPATRFGIPVGLIVPAMDLGCRWAAGGIQLAQTIEGWDDIGEPPTPSPSPVPSPLPNPSPSPQRWRRFLPTIRR